LLIAIALHQNHTHTPAAKKTTARWVPALHTALRGEHAPKQNPFPPQNLPYLTGHQKKREY
jgi:hypothetical protein